MKKALSAFGWSSVVAFAVGLAVLLAGNLGDPGEIGLFPLVGAVMFGPPAVALASFGFGSAALVPPRDGLRGALLLGLAALCLAVTALVWGVARGLD